MSYIQEENIFYACGTPITVAQNEKGETHAYCTKTGEQLSTSDLKFGKVYGGGKDTDVDSTDVVMKSGFLFLLAAGGEGKSVKNTASVTLEGGMIGGYLYGGGNGDKIGNVYVKVTGGAIKHGFFGCGNSIECGDVTIDFDGIICTNVTTGTRHPDGVITGKTKVVMNDGHILDFKVGGGKHLKDATVEVYGGYIEKQFIKALDGKLDLKIYENIFISNGVAGQFPMIPEGADVSYLPAVEREAREDFYGDDSEFFDKSEDKNNLVIRFFELRHPDVPRSATPFPAPFTGDCHVITFPDGRNMMVDTGNLYSEKEMSDGLERLGITELEVFVMTHPHGDHMANASKLIDKVKIKEIWIPDIDAQPALVAEQQRLIEYNAVIEKAKNNGTKIVPVADGDVFTFGDVEILVLNPVRDGKPAVDMNENSVAMKVTYKENSAILCADITDKSEKRLVSQYGDKLKTDLLKVPHHGIVYQSYYEFMDFCKPQAAFIHSIRDDGVFIRTTKYSYENVNGFDINNLFVAGRHGKVKVVFDGKSKNIKVIPQYK